MTSIANGTYNCNSSSNGVNVNIETADGSSNSKSNGKGIVVGAASMAKESFVAPMVTSIGTSVAVNNSSNNIINGEGDDRNRLLVDWQSRNDSGNGDVNIVSSVFQ